jgi:Arc/MetJ-type ribon-helix-helix transcriptional regulator
MDVRLDSRSQHLIEQQIRDGRYRSPEEVIVRALETLAERESTRWEEQERRELVQEMLEFAGKHRFTLGEQGLRIRNLIHEAHKY